MNADGQQSALHGTAFFLRKLNELTDKELAGPSLIPGWSRSMVVADVGYRARALSRLLESALGAEEVDYPSVEYRLAEIRYGGSLAPRALRHLVAHSAVQFRVVMRDFPPTSWHVSVSDVSGHLIRAEMIPVLRAENVWGRAIDLNNGAVWDEVPSAWRIPDATDR